MQLYAASRYFFALDRETTIYYGNKLMLTQYLVLSG